MNTLPLMFFAGLIATAWCGVLAILLQASRKQQRKLFPLPSGHLQAGLKRLSVIIPARNEEACIERCVRSLLRQDYSNLEVIAVNDRSTDGTAAILDRLELEFPNQFRAVHITTLPEGWFGKPHALDVAMQSATGSLILFTDSDCEFLAPSALRTAAAEFDRRGLDFYTIGASYTMPTLQECLSVPACSEVVLQWLRPERAEDPNWPDTFANGAFIMVDRLAFDTLGGWGAVRTKVSEDFELARAFKRLGYRVGLSQAKGIYQTRSYPTLREAWNGWSRIFAGSLTTKQLITTVVRMSVMTMVPLIAMLWATTYAILTGDTGVFLRGAMPAFVFAYAVRTAIDFMVFNTLGAPLAAAILAPIGRVFSMATATRAALARMGLAKTHWRGASFSANRMITLPQTPVTLEIQTREIRGELVAARRAAAS